MKKNNIIIHLVIVLSIILFMLMLHNYGCLFKFIFGISCPTCGMTRAMLSILKFDFGSAFYYHASWPFIIIFFILAILIKLKVIKTNKKVIVITLLTFAILNFIYYFYRLFSGSSIVYLDFKGSLIYKVYSMFTNLL